MTPQEQHAFDPGNLPVGYFADPYPILHALRSAAPVHRCPDGSIYLTRHADLFEVYRDPRTFSSDKTEQFRPLLGDSALYEHHTTSLVFNDPPVHTRVRRAFGNGLSPKAVGAMEGWVQALVDGLLDRIETLGEFDLIEDFAAAIPIEVIGSLLRIPHDERGPLRAWSLAILGALEFRLTDERLAEGNAAVRDFVAFLDEFVQRRRVSLTEDEDDLLARLIRWEGDDGYRLDGIELYHQIVFLLNAGHETTTNLIANGVLALLEHDEQWDLLTSDPTVAASAVEECLRFEPPIQLNNRRTTCETVIGGVTLPAGTNVTLSLAAANRDPAVFDQPDALDIRRDPNPHLCFGSGIHTCAGLHVARLEGRIALRSLATRFPQLRAVGPEERAHRARFRVVLRAPMATGPY
ncbi:MAG: cytochrome P450 [Chromatiales bacterium]|jgi:cytochrome P450|nr:cytochrome P450 [Chromatiales bacterium]